uniref:Myb-like domain-containing protein n=2 Tax=Pelagomonas calceolata TaxID=35677 RepID=A0A7S4E4X3_9STRA|mmetsp:Transcript_8496/g.24101  ORF Transcript_8496/g.24101 Transcript_8496/m.24101 type:complete len:427 (+) Transcript_8496:232-1512(+)
MAKDDQLPPKKAKKGAAEPKKSREGEKKPKWTPEEDDALKGLVDELGSRGAWPQIAQRLGTGRSPAAVEQHWRGGGGEAPKKPIKEKKKAGPRGSPGPKPTGSVKVKTAAGRVCYVLEKKQRGYFAVEMDGKANKEGGAFERKSLRRPQFAPGQDALLDSAPPSDSLAQAFSTNPAAIRARKAREESRAQHGPPVKGPQAPAITGRVRVVATTNAASPGVAALHNGRTGVVTKRAAGWIEVQLDATRDKPSETIPCRKRDLVKVDEAGRALETPQGPAPALKRKPKKEWAERARREAGMRGDVEEEEEEAPRVVQRVKPAKKKDGGPPLTTAEKAAVLHAIAQLDGKATQKKVRRAAESALGAPEGALDEKKAAVKEVCEDEMSKQASESAPKKRKASGMSAEEALRAELKALKAENKKLKREKQK